MAWVGRWRWVVALCALGGGVLLAGCPGTLDDPGKYVRADGGTDGGTGSTTSTTTTTTGNGAGGGGGAAGTGGAGGM